MNITRLSVLALICALSCSVGAGAAESVSIQYQESLKRLEMIRREHSNSQSSEADTMRSLRFDAFGKTFDVNLKSNKTLLSAEDRDRFGSRLEIYRGDITGMPNSWARLVLADGQPRGMLWDGSEMYAIEVGADEEPFIYRLKDLQITPGMLTCSTASSTIKSAGNAGRLLTAVLNEVSQAQGPGAVSQIDVAVIGDAEFTAAKGATASTALVTRMNNVDGIFSMQLGVQLNVNRIDTFNLANDPFSDESEAGALLDELAAFRFATSTQNANGLSHLFTGRELDGTTVGVAFGEALCSRQFSAGLTQGNNSTTLDSLIAAHEIGHNFGAPHDGVDGSACELEPEDFLMAPRLNGSDMFSACSITEMQDDVSGARCITPLPSTDVAVVSANTALNIPLGNSVMLTFDINSIGTNAANGVSVDVSIPSGVTLNSATSSAGTCASGAGNVSCAIGAIAAGSGETVTIDATTTATGVQDFVAIVTADADENGNNNQATVQVSVDPAVDLVSSAGQAVQVAVDQSTTVRLSVENRSALTATGVSVTITPGAGLRIDSASWAAGSCSVAAGDASCTAASLAAQADSTIDLQVTGISAGTVTYTISASANEVDRDPSDNDATGQVTVTDSSPGAPGNGSGSGGGGSLAWAAFLFLSFFVAATRVHSAASRPIR